MNDTSCRHPLEIEIVVESLHIDAFFAKEKKGFGGWRGWKM